MAKLTTADRKALPKQDFAGPGRSYPIPDKSHAAQALRMKGHASPEEQKNITAKVHAKFPGVGSSSQSGVAGATEETQMGSMLASVFGRKKK